MRSLCLLQKEEVPESPVPVREQENSRQRHIGVELSFGELQEPDRVALPLQEVAEVLLALAQPHRFYLLQRVQDVFTKLSDEKQTEISTLLEACGMKSLLEAVLSRGIARSENLEVWQ